MSCLRVELKDLLRDIDFERLSKTIKFPTITKVSSRQNRPAPPDCSKN
ncbi:MAG: hypothetical protein U0X75_10745 [Acidobacteriota bacterium]